MSDVYYVSGPMTGYEDFNRPAFHAAAKHLRALGHEVINPAELPGEDDGHDWTWFLRRDLVELTKCSHIVLLPGWSRSNGARLELHVALALEMQVLYLEQATKEFA